MWQGTKVTNDPIRTKPMKQTERFNVLVAGKMQEKQRKEFPGSDPKFFSTILKKPTYSYEPYKYLFIRVETVNSENQIKRRTKIIIRPTIYVLLFSTAFSATKWWINKAEKFMRIWICDKNATDPESNHFCGESKRLWTTRRACVSVQGK